MDKLQISKLKVSTQIGIHAWEKKIKQHLFLDISIPLDCSACEDDIANTIDYDALCKQITNFIESHSFQLIETVAEKTAELIKKTFGANEISVRVSKPYAVENAGEISVWITR